MARKRKFELDYELKERVVEALLVGFNKPIYLEYPIPGPVYIKRVVNRGLNDLSGKLESRVEWGLTYALHGHKGHPEFLDNYMSHRRDILGMEWFYGQGSLYRFRRGERKKAQARVEVFFTLDELKNFRDLHKSIRKILSE